MLLFTFKSNIMPEYVYISNSENTKEVIANNLILFKKIIKKFKITEIEVNKINSIYVLKNDINKSKFKKYNYNKKTLYEILKEVNIININNIENELYSIEEYEIYEILKNSNAIIKYNDRYHEYDFQFINQYNNLIEINCQLKINDEFINLNPNYIYLIKLNFVKFLTPDKIVSLKITKNEKNNFLKEIKKIKIKNILIKIKENLFINNNLDKLNNTKKRIECLKNSLINSISYIQIFKFKVIKWLSNYF